MTISKPESFPTKIRTTVRPTEEVEVDEPGWTDTHRQGLILESSASTDSGRQQAAEKQTAPGAADTQKETPAP